MIGSRRIGRDLGGDEIEPPAWVILHQPLNLHIFRKNGKKPQKMNGPPVCPCQKSENAPTWRPRKHFFGPRFWPLFLLFFLLILHLNPPSNP